ncbi:hypothetical protein F511_17125 [Dorcoceras hygrometricum]|uniref:Uncharacterized protein n=1 Tax=Dorcoceras hygrometricum TaxID=472368 RepID=A0A2Z7CUC0_9LAMI|nr:hypothetical protein F511_17125 [Dorcoceras hygrometricum]
MCAREIMRWSRDGRACCAAGGCCFAQPVAPMAGGRWPESARKCCAVAGRNARNLCAILGAWRLVDAALGSRRQADAALGAAACGHAPHAMLATAATVRSSSDELPGSDAMANFF